MRVDLLKELGRASGHIAVPESSAPPSPNGQEPLVVEHDAEDIEQVVHQVQERLLREYPELFQRSLIDPTVRDQLANVIRELIEQTEHSKNNYRIKLLTETIIERIIGIGPLERFMHDESVTEIMVNSPTDVFVERNGKLERIPRILFRDEEHVLQMAQRIVARVGRVINTENPMVDARLPDGSRVNIVIPPISPHVSITIRRIAKEVVNWHDMLRLGAITADMIEFLQAMVTGRVNIVIAGGTGAGKTTLLRQMAKFIPPTERIITIEDIDELRLEHPNLVRMEARRGRYEIFDLLVNSLRMRPDRIIIGEIRGKESVEFLDAAGTGHPGSMTTVHSESPERTVTRMARMMIKAGYEIPYQEIVKQIHETIELIVYVRRMPDGSRKVTRISEVHADGRLSDIFRLRLDSTDPHRPRWYHEQVGVPSEQLQEKCLENGVTIPERFMALERTGDAR